MTQTELFGDPISIYTREQAIEDGELVDVTGTAHEAGLKAETVITRALWSVINIDAKKHRTAQSTTGRLWDVVWMVFLAARRSSNLDRVGTYVRLGRKNEHVIAVIDGDGITIGFPSDF